MPLLPPLLPPAALDVETGATEVLDEATELTALDAGRH